MKLFPLLTFCLTLLLPSLTLAQAEEAVTWRYERITQVYINGTTSFMFMIEDDDGSTAPIPISCGGARHDYGLPTTDRVISSPRSRIRIYHDLESGAYAWAEKEMTPWNNWNGNECLSLTIHLPVDGMISPGVRNRGKFGQNPIHVLE